MNTSDSPPRACAGPPRLLLVEDNPTSSAFLSAVLRGIPAVVDCADSTATARARADACRYDLWMLDVQLPDGGGVDLLAQLRAGHPDVPALAHTASTEAALHASLIEAGFVQVLVKPLPVGELQVAVRHALGLPVVHASDGNRPPAQQPSWDDEAAARAMNFNRTHLEALRELFLRELPSARQAIMAAAQAGDLAAMAGGLHRLKASCGFVGAARLRAAVAELQASPSNAALVVAFDQAAEVTAADAGTSQPDGCSTAL